MTLAWAFIWWLEGTPHPTVYPFNVWMTWLIICAACDLGGWVVS